MKSVTPPKGFFEPPEEPEHRDDCAVNSLEEGRCNCAKLDEADKNCRADDKNKAAKEG